METSLRHAFVVSHCPLTGSRRTVSAVHTHAITPLEKLWVGYDRPQFGLRNYESDLPVLENPKIEIELTRPLGIHWTPLENVHEPWRLSGTGQQVHLGPTAAFDTMWLNW